MVMKRWWGREDGRGERRRRGATTPYMVDCSHSVYLNAAEHLENVDLSVVLRLA